ncbi:MAG: ATP-binding protein [Bacteroidales bacterium]|nr:ATP-binding protein [Candidatus Scybalocola fimicaballi]
MERLVMNKLVEWKNKKNRKPLILNGARQVGKTWLLKELGKQYYDDVAYFMCDKDDEITRIFSSNFDIKRILMQLSARISKDILPEKTLIIFDEIQSSPRVLEGLKFFCEEASEYHVAVAGSLLGISLHNGVSFPVGKVDMIRVYPMNFEEFLLAAGQNKLVDILTNKDYESINTLKETYEKYLRQYYFVGGMPAAVNAHVEEEGLEYVRSIQQQILFDYSRDFSKHVSKSDIPRVNMVWQGMPAQLFKENKKFIYGVLKDGGRAKEFETAIQWLIDAGLVYKVNRCKAIKMPLKAYEDFTAFKLFLCDCGLLGALAEIPASHILVGDEAIKEYKGGFTEQYVLQQMISRDSGSIYYYSTDNSRLEIDFLAQKEGKVVPIEVKAEGNVRANSLSEFLKSNPEIHGIRYSMLPYIQQEHFDNLPLWAVE